MSRCKEFQCVRLGFFNNPLFITFLLPFCTSCTSNMSPEVIGDTNFSKLNKRVALWTEDTAIWSDNGVLMLVSNLI